MSNLVLKCGCEDGGDCTKITVCQAESFIDELQAKLDACLEYLKENETPAQCIARNRKDMTNSMKQVAEQMKRAGKAEAQLDIEIRERSIAEEKLETAQAQLVQLHIRHPDE